MSCQSPDYHLHFFREIDVKGGLMSRVLGTVKEESNMRHTGKVLEEDARRSSSWATLWSQKDCLVDAQRGLISTLLISATPFSMELAHKTFVTIPVI
jgi:hypothetical protein